eukprot:231245-Karenia_brevis.AAC.1
MPLCILSLDMQKAFDRIEYDALFTALSSQGVPDHYVHLLRALYSNQRGSVMGSRQFLISRGVKQ